MTFGVTTTGFEAPTQQDLLAQVEADEKANISPLVDVSAPSPLGQVNGIFTRQLAILWEQMQAVYKARDPDAAEGDALDSISKMTGTERRAATFSTVPVDCDLNNGTILEPGVHFVSINGNPDVRFTLSESVGEEFQAPFAGVFSLPFRAENAGPVAAPAHTLTVIATPLTGWNSADNAADAILGRPVDDDATLRTRREQELAAAGSCTTSAIDAAVLKVSGVESVTVFENFGTFTDGNGLPPGSFEVLLWDGASPAADNDTIAQTIWDNKPAGIRSYGTGQTGTAHDRNPKTQVADGTAHTVQFSRVAQLQFWITVTLTTDANYVGNSTFAADLAEAANAFFNGAGVTVIAERLKAFAIEIEGVVDVVLMQFGTAASPTNTANVPTGTRQLPRFDSSRIVVL